MHGTSIALAAVTALAAAHAAFGAIAPGTISVVRVGDGALPLAGDVAQSVSIVTYDLNSGAALGVTPLPGVVLPSKNDDADGHLNLSGDGRYLTLGGYASTPGAPNPAAASVNRAVVRVDGAGNVAVASLPSVYLGQTINAVASPDGDDFFIVGGNDAAGTGGLRYLDGIGSTATVNVSRTQSGANADSYRNARIVSGQLFINTPSQGSFTNRGVYAMTIGGGLPVAPVATPSVATPVIVNTEGSKTDASGNVSPDTTGKLYPKTDSAFVDTDSDGVFDVAYSTGGKEDLEKWVLTAGKWVRTDTVDAPPVTVAGRNNEINAIDFVATAGGIDLFLANDFGIWRFTDTGGSGAFASAALSGDTDINGRRYLTSSDYFIAAGADQQFRGLAVVVPEPGMTLFAGGVMAGILGRRRKA